MDQDDESLVKYKAALLGNIDAECSPADDPRRVVIQGLEVIFKDAPPITYSNLNTAAAVNNLKTSTAENPIQFIEGCFYKIKVIFKIQHEIVSGLRYVNKVSRGPVGVMTQKEMLGSYGPQREPHTVVFPRREDEWEQAPSGMLARGKYNALSRFVDDDKQVHLEFEYSFQIKKGK